MSVSDYYRKYINATKPAQNNLTGAAVGVVLALSLRNKAGALAKPTVGRTFVDARNGKDTNKGTETAPFATLTAAAASIAKPTTKEEYETPQEIILAPGDYSGEAMVTLPQRSGVFVFARSSLLPIMRAKPDLSLQFGSLIPPQVVVSGDVGEVDLAPLFPDDALPVGLVKLGDGKDAFKIEVDTANPSGLTVSFVNADIRGDISFVGDWSGLLGSPYVTFEGCNIQSAGTINGIGQGPGATTPVGILQFRGDCVVSQPAFVVDVESVAGFVGGYADGSWTVQAAPAAPFIRGWNGVYIPATFTWTGPVLSMIMDGTTNYWITTNVATVAAGDKVVAEDDTP